MESKQLSFMERLFKRKEKERAAEQADQTPVDESKIPVISPVLPHTILVFTPEQETAYSIEEKAALQKKLESIPVLRTGEINFVPFECGPVNGGGYFVKVFIRQGRDVSEVFTLPEMPLYLLDNSGEKVAGGFFKPQNFGMLKFGETRVWTFIWSPEEVIKPDADLSFYTVRFE